MKLQTPPNDPAAKDIPALVTRLGRESVELVRTEAQVARVEFNEKLDEVKAGAISLAVSCVMLAGGLLILLQAAVYGLALELPMWASALIVGGTATAFALISAAIGSKKLSADNLKPEHTQEQVERDIALAKEQAA